MLDEEEFLSPTASARSQPCTSTHPFELRPRRPVLHASATSRPSRRTGLFGGNSNWRGPVWFPLNYLLVEALQRFHHYYGDDFLVELPDRLGPMLTLERGRRRTLAAR